MSDCPVLPRPRLWSALSDSGPLVVLTACRWAGKTTLVRSWASTVSAGSGGVTVVEAPDGSVPADRYWARVAALLPSVSGGIEGGGEAFESVRFHRRRADPVRTRSS